MKLVRRTMLALALGCAPIGVHAQDDRGLRLSDSGSPTPVFDRLTPEAWVVNQVGSAVVNIAGVMSTDPRIRSLDPEELFSLRSNSQGSGVVITPEGYIITNNHVIQRSRRVLIQFNEKYDSKIYEAEVIATDPDEDLALLKIEKRGEDEDFPFVRLGRSSDLMIGERVIAIGNPYGRANTVSSGILSAMDRDIQVQDPFTGQLRTFDGLLQTDASINPGNSGGPLLNVHAELIGINNAIFRTAQNISFAIPVDKVAAILQNHLFNVNRTTRFDLGFELEDRPEGIFIREIDPQSPAYEKGLRRGDRVVSVDGQPTRSIHEFSRAALPKRPGDPIGIAVNATSGRREVTLALPGFDPERYLEWRLGMLVSPETYLVPRKYFGRVYEERRTHLEVKSVREDSPARRIGLKPGDLLWRVGPTEASVDPKYGWMTSTAVLADYVREDLIAGQDHASFWLSVYRQSEATAQEEPYLVGEISL